MNRSSKRLCGTKMHDSPNLSHRYIFNLADQASKEVPISVDDRRISALSSSLAIIEGQVVRVKLMVYEILRFV